MRKNTYGRGHFSEKCNELEFLCFIIKRSRGFSKTPETPSFLYVFSVELSSYVCVYDVGLVCM